MHRYSEPTATASKVLRVNEFVSYSIYNVGEDNSRSFISNERLHTDFILEDISSDLWNVIVTSNGSFDSVYDYACKHNVEDTLDDFLDELYYYDLISYENNSQSENNLSDGVLFQDKKISNQLIESKKEYLFKNNFLYSLSINLPNDLSSGEVFINIIDDAVKIGVNHIILVFDGKILDNNFFKISDYIRKYHILLTLKTSVNTLFETLKMHSIRGGYFHRIIFPLYSINDEINYKITGKKDFFKKVVEVTTELIQNNNLITVYYEQKNENIDSFDEVYDFIKLNGIELCCCNKTLLNKKLDILNFYNDNYLEIRSNHPEITKAKQKLFVSPNLHLYGDDKYSFSLGDLNNRFLTDIWKEIIEKKEGIL